MQQSIMAAMNEERREAQRKARRKPTKAEQAQRVGPYHDSALVRTRFVAWLPEGGYPTIQKGAEVLRAWETVDRARREAQALEKQMMADIRALWTDSEIETAKVRARRGY